jgi:hypothetical protein
MTINRAPILTLWATVIAERLGFDRSEALTLAKAVAGLNAQSKGRRGVLKPQEENAEIGDEPFMVELLGRTVRAIKTLDGVRATSRGKPISPASVELCLKGKFGDNLNQIQKAMLKVAKSYRPKELALVAYHLYEQFRPEIPDGVKGWGVAGELDVRRIESLAKKRVAETSKH